MNVLLIEDNPGDARLIELMLREAGGMQLQWVDRLREGLEALHNNANDLVLLDLGLPDSHGLETLGAVRKANHETPVVVLTGNNDEEMALDALKAGAQDYLVKGNVNADALKRVIRYAIERKRAERKILESEKRHQHLLGLIQEGVWALDAEGVTTYVNPGMARMLGYDPQEMLGKSFLDFMDQERHEKARANFERRRKGISEKHEFQFVRKDGSALHALISTSPIHDEEGVFAGALALVMDVTEQRRLQEQLLRAQRLDSIGHLAGGVAHDFNNVLSIVIGYSDIVLGKLPPNSPLKAKVESIISAGERGAALARQLLIFGRKQVAEPKPLDLGRTLAEFEKMLKRLIGEKVELVSEVDADLWAIRADPTLMEQVIMNLSINARDAMPDGGALTCAVRNASFPRTRTLLDTTVPAGNYVVLAVSDSGTGIPGAVRTHLYEPFFSTKPSGKGTGLGLSVVYGIVKQAEGYISCETEVGKGTTFRIWFPRFHQEAEQTTSAANTALPGGNETVLVVEDQPDLLTMVAGALSEWGYRCLKAHDGEEALALARKEQVQVLLTDVVLPTMDGKRLAGEIRALQPGLGVIYMSGYQTPAEAEESKGVVVLQKPFPLPLLAQTVRAVLDGRDAAKESRTAAGGPA